MIEINQIVQNVEIIENPTILELEVTQTLSPTVIVEIAPTNFSQGVPEILQGYYVDASRFNDLSLNPYTPNANVLYVDNNDNKIYRWNETDYVPTSTENGGTGGGGATNLSYTASPTNGIVTSDTGTDATIPLVGENAGLLSPSDKTKLDTIQTGAEANVNADWNAITGDALILNKPTIPTALSQLTDDATHRVVTDIEIATWNALIGGSIFQSVWDATTNTPILASGVGTKGFYYIVNVAGSTNLDGIIDWKIGDWAIFDGTVWRKVDNTDAVSSVNGLTGAVLLDTSNVPDTNDKRYITEAERVILNNTSGVNTGDNATNTSANAYADTKVQDDIVDGVIDKAPSQNAVFDALGSKQNTLVSGTNIQTLGGQSILGAGDIPFSETLTTAVNITSATLTDNSKVQEGKIILIENGVNNINYTVNGVNASFVKKGTGTITFVQGAGRTLIPANGTLVFSGGANSTASIVSKGTVDVLFINTNVTITGIPVRNIIKDAVPSFTHTGTLTETILKSYLIPANTFAANDIMDLRSLRVISNDSSALVKSYLNTTNSLIGATQLTFLNNYGVGNEYSKINRTFTINSGTLKGWDFNQSTGNYSSGVETDSISSNQTLSSMAFNPAIDNYFIVTSQLTNVANTSYLQELLMTT
jgi:hypothetical protein